MMKLTIDYTVMKQLCQDLNKAVKEMNSVKSEVASIRSGFGSDSTGQNSKKILSKAISSINTGYDDLAALANVAEKAVELYRNCDDSLFNKNLSSGKGQVFEFPDGQRIVVPEEEKESFLSKLTHTVSDIYLISDPSGLIKVISKAGADGAIVGGLWGIADKIARGDGLGAAKSALGLIGGVATKVANPLFNGKAIDWFGKSDYVFKESFAKQFDDYFKFTKDTDVGFGAKASTAVGTVCKWAGLGLTTYSNYKKNVEEYNSKTDYHVYVETAVETATDILLEKGMEFAVGAAVVAAGATAPAWAVGVVSAGTVFLVDKGVEALTGKDIGEWTADAVNVVVDKTVDVVKETGKKVGKCAKAVKKGAISVWKGFKKLF